MSIDGAMIRDLFERDPGRRIESIVRVDQHDSDVVKTELDEYVVTEGIKKDFSDIITLFIGSRTSVPESVCGWISGFFGSGKSHFLKILGYVLSNRPVKVNGGSSIGASPLFCNKHSIPGGAILDKELRTKAVFVNMLTFDIERGPSITRIIYEAVLKELGLSTVGWIAEIERTLKKDGLWDKFLKFVRQQEGKEWQEVRTMQVKARPIIARALHELDAQRFSSREIADKSIDDVQKSIQLDQSVLAERLLEIAEELDPNNGRVVVLLDEVGLYVGTNPDRLNDLNAVAEQITKIGKGKVWLFVTAQEALEEALPKVLGYTSQFQKIKDRFQIKIELTPENIDTVVKKRLLQKKIGDKKLDILKNMYSQYSGNLTTAALIKNPARDYRNLFTQLDFQQFVDYYPLMPYDIRLMQEIFGLLRARGSAPQALTGRERAVLQVVRSILLGLSNSEVGRLATFDMVYDSINEELKTIRSAQHTMIEKDITEKGKRGQVGVGSVAKALFLIQHVGQWLPCTAENIAATLYPRLGVDRNEHLTDVKKCLEVLMEAKWITEEEGKYRFLSEIERTFEQDVERQSVSEPERREISNEVIKQVLSEVKTYSYNGTRTFTIHITADEYEITSTGHINLIFFSPMRVAADKDLPDTIRAKSVADRETVYWISKADERYEDSIERAIKTGKALAEREHSEQSDEEMRALDKHKRDLELLVHDDLPRILSKAASSGIIVYQGEEFGYDGTRNIHDIFGERIRKLIEEIFTEFSYADSRVEKDDHIGSILTWQGGKLPKIYHELQLVDEASNILVDRAVPSRVLGEVRRRADQGPESQTGASIAEHFERAPYGWDPKIVRLALATLFKNGSLMVNIAGKEYVSPSESRSHEAFVNARTFNKTRFLLGQEISKEQRKEASDLINEIFGEPAGNTNEEVDKSLVKAINSRISDCGRLATIANIQNLPVKNGLDQLHKSMMQVLDASASTRRILSFLDEKSKGIFKTQIPVLDKLIKFEKNQNLQRYNLTRSFLERNAQSLLSAVEDENVLKATEKLKHALASEEFLARWSDIYGDFQKILNRYSTIYNKKHKERTTLAEDAIKELEKHPAMSGSLKKDVGQKLSRLQEFVCQTEKISVDEENTICDKCKSILTDIMHHIEMIPSRKLQIQSELTDVWSKKEAPKEEKEKLKGFEVTITSSKEIADVTKKVKDVSEAAVKQGKSVKVNVKVD